MSSNDPPDAELALALPEPARSLLAEISVLIARISAHMSSVSPGEVQNVLAAHRQTFYRTMDAFGVGIIHFLAEDPPPDQIQAVRERITAQIREWSSTSPLLQHSLRKPRGQSSDPELVKALLRERPAGADIAALVFDDYYRYSVGGMAFRDRLEMLVQAVLQTVARCAAAGVNPVRVLSLHASGAGEILLLAQNETFAEIAEVTCIDNRPAALREVSRQLKGRLEKHFSCVHADALQYAEGPDRSHHHYHVIYGVSVFEHLGMSSASLLVRNCHTLLAPGGILLVGSVTPSVPAGEQILRAWLTDWDLQYRDETAWRHVFARSGFDANALRFEYEQYRANVIVSAERDGRE
jgi:2-polyprenyl-3-methyl-5-hydroxy-6-metoxy-1,4-benzoquinol methylase